MGRRRSPLVERSFRGTGGDTSPGNMTGTDRTNDTRIARVVPREYLADRISPNRPGSQGIASDVFADLTTELGQT